MPGLESLANMEYPGRFVILGRDKSGNNNVVVYGITERNASNQARKFVEDKSTGVIRTEVTDIKQLETGNPALLIYPAIAFMNNAVLVSDGAQTSLLYKACKANSPGTNAEKILKEAFEIASYVYDPKNGWVDITRYEPDDPHFTPRISGCLQPNNAAIYMMRRYEYVIQKRCLAGIPRDSCYNIALEAGKGKLVSTYSGANSNPLPTFQGEPLDVALEQNSADETAKSVYDALQPKDPAKDFRVGVAAVYSNIKTLENKIAIINRCDLGGK